MFMESGHYQTHIKKLRKLYSQKLSAVTDTFAEEASDFVTVKNTSSGISVILNVKSRKTTEELKRMPNNSASLQSLILKKDFSLCIIIRSR